LLDWEWSNAGPLDVDFGEMDYGKEESFSDSPDVSLQDQQNYIYTQFANNGVPLPKGYREREDVLNVVCSACCAAAECEGVDDGREEYNEMVEALAKLTPTG